MKKIPWWVWLLVVIGWMISAGDYTSLRAVVGYFSGVAILVAISIWGPDRK